MEKESMSLSLTNRFEEMQTMHRLSYKFGMNTVSICQITA